MAAVFSLFFAELTAFRWGTARLAKLGGNYDTHGHDQGYGGAHAAHGPEVEKSPTAPATTQPKSSSSSDAESQTHAHVHLTHESSPLAQIISVVILEFGVVFHSVIIGLTLAVDQAFKVLFVVIVFHQMFEGLGLGTRLAGLKLPPSYKWAPLFGAIAYGLTTPIGIAAGLGVRTTYNPGSTTATIVSGIFDSVSSGILLYTGLVELLAHEFLFNKEMHEASTGKVAFAGASVLFGAGVMALLGRWA
jgi:solute carrier family 39 (zinc transporter), member 1/2/3